MKHFYILLTLIFATSTLGAQTTKEEVYETPEKSGGVYYAYPENYKNPQTEAPKGYDAFYISHYGRHGSRYLIKDSEYKWVLDLLADAKKNNALTTLGIDTHNRLEKVWEEARGRGGDLSPLGVRQHKGIAERMYKSYPEVFVDGLEISARSTMVVRCVLSMVAFSESLKELNPTLQITKESSERYVPYLNPHTKEAIAFRSGNSWREELRKFEVENTQSDRLIASLFTDKEYVYKHVNASSLMWGLYWIASDMQNMEVDISFYDLFQKEELFQLWQARNFRIYINDGNWKDNGNLMFENSKPLLKNILESANEVIAKNGKGATLRFGHDGNLIPLTLLLHLDGCYNSVSESSEVYKAWSDFKVSPMAGNVQMIFFRKKGLDDILVKFLHNEKETLIPTIKTDIAPYYHWTDVEKYYNGLLAE